MEASALHDFNPHELSFKKGQILKVLSPSRFGGDKMWLKAEINGRDGLVPANCISLRPCIWYREKISRQEAEAILVNPEQDDGAFLIRPNDSNPGEFVLSVKSRGRVYHFKVMRDSAGKYYMWTIKFNSLNQLVEFYRTSSVSRRETILLRDLKRTSDKYFRTVRAIYDFIGREPGELSFMTGDYLTVLDKVDENWLRGERNGIKGRFPKVYVSDVLDPNVWS